MRKPKSVVINGKRFSINYVEDPKKISEDGSLAMGCVIYREQKINIFKDMYSNEEAFSTLLHEVLHAISRDLQLCLEDECNHKDLNTLATSLADTLVRNKWISLKEWTGKK